MARTRGQALVETALILPVLLLLTVLAIDVGRAFLGSIGVHNLSRIGANYAAANPASDWSSGSRFEQLMLRDAQAIGCGDSVVITPPVFDPSPPVMGGQATVDVSCSFELVTPLAGDLMGGVIDVTATSTFPVRGLCAGCEPPPPLEAPDPAPEDVCNRPPELVGLSVGGARLAWELAGFSGSVTVVDDADDGRTVTSATPDAVPDDDGCLPHPTGVSLTAASIPPPEDCPDGAYVPNLKGMRVSEARTVWTDAGFQDDTILPDTAPGGDLVATQAFAPDPAAPDVCVDEELTTVTITTDPAPAPMEAYCKVPDLHLRTTEEARPVWSDAGFVGSFSVLDGASEPFVIQYQSLVAHSHELCSAPITVGPDPLEESP